MNALSSSRARSCALTPSSPARAPLPSEVSDPIVTIDTSKMTLALEEGSKKTKYASNARGHVSRRRHSGGHAGRLSLLRGRGSWTNALKLGLREGKGLYHQHGQQGEPSALDEILLEGLLHRLYKDTVHWFRTQECEEAG